jgi:uncharacterized protein
VNTIRPTEITFDHGKSAANALKRGLPFSVVETDFNCATARVVEDTRKEYGEQRFRALGFIGTRLHAVVFTPRANATEYAAQT